MDVQRLKSGTAAGRLSQLLFLTYSLLLLGFFYVPNAVDLYKYYSVAVLPVMLLLLPRVYPLLRGNTLFLLALAYLAYMLATPAWGDSFQWKPYLNYLRLALYVITFVVATIHLRHTFPGLFDVLLHGMGLAASAAAVASIVLWARAAGPSPMEMRLVGIGILEHPNPSAFVYGFFALVNLGLFLRAGKAWLRWLHLLAALPLFVFVALTQSRGGLVATVAGVSALFFIRHPQRTFLVVFALAEAVALAILYAPDFLGASTRGTSARLLIWQSVWENAMTAPWFGHGYLSQESVYVAVQKATHAFAHDAYLGTLRDGGAVGLALFAACIGYALWQAVKYGKSKGDFLYLALLVFGLVCMTFDTDRLLTRPRELWIIFWLPMALIMSLGQARSTVTHERLAAQRLVTESA